MKKTNGYTQIKANVRKNKKRKEADIRQANYDSLTLSEKIKLTMSRGGSKKELNRLTQMSENLKQSVKKTTDDNKVKVVTPIIKISKKKKVSLTTKS